MFPRRSILSSLLPSCLLLSSLLVTGAAAQITQPTVWAAKPDVAAFEKMENDRLAAAQQSVAKLVAVKGQRTIENTLVPFDEAIRQINSTAYLAGLLQQVHPDATFRDHATAMVTRASAAQTALSLNRDVYNALTALDLTRADNATRYYVKRQLLEFRLAGVDKDEATRMRIRKLSDQATEEQSMFDRNISDSQKSVEAEPSELDGLPQDFIARHKPGPDGKIRITTDYPDALPVLNFAKNDALRRRLYLAFTTRAYPKNQEVLIEPSENAVRDRDAPGLFQLGGLQRRRQDDRQRAKTSQTSSKSVNDAARPLADQEFKMLLAEKQKTNPEAKEVCDYEASYYAELVRRSQYNFDSQSVRPYFPFQQVKQGILDAASDLFRVTFKQEPNVPSWDPTVETWIVLDKGKPIGRFYLDMHPRPGKFSHAEMAPVLDGIRGKQLPEAMLVCNFPAANRYRSRR